MKKKKKMLSVLSMIAVMLLCCVNITYAWESLHQTALNVYIEEIKEEPDGPEEDQKPDPEPDEKPKPEKPSSKPGNTSKPSEKPSDDETAKNDQIKVPEGTIVNGKYQMTTGDTCEFVFYMLLMLISFAVMIILGAVLIALLIHEWEKKRRR